MTRIAAAFRRHPENWETTGFCLLMSAIGFASLAAGEPEAAVACWLMAAVILPLAWLLPKGRHRRRSTTGTAP